jgi:hypothetical protein
MDPKAAAKQLAGLVRELGTAYALMAAALAVLPVPVRLPSQAGDPALAMRSLTLTWELASDAGLAPLTLTLVREMISGWTTAYELTVIASTSGPAPWRLRGIEDALTRVRRNAALVKQQVDGDFTGYQASPGDLGRLGRRDRRARETGE